MYEVLKNWKVVLLSLGGATTFWFFNALNKDYNAVINYPIEFQFAKDSVVILDPLPNTVTIDVSSGGWNLIRKTLFFNVTPIQIELENPTEISYYTRSALFPLVIDQLEELQVNYLVTDTLYINIDKKWSRKFLAKVDSLAIPLQEGYRLTSAIRISPDTIELTGARSFLDTLGRYYYLSFNTKEIDDPFDKSMEVNGPERAQLVSNPKELDVAFEVERFERMKVSVDVEPINFPNDSSLYLSRSKVDVMFTIPESKRKKIDASDFAITADRAMFKKRDSTVLAMLMYYPDGATEVQLEPEYIKVHYGK